MNYDWGKILIASEKASFYEDVFVAPHDMAENSNLGQLFVLFLFKGKDKKLVHKAHDLMDLIVSSYYSSPTSDIESSLTSTCQTINFNLTDIFGNKIVSQPGLNILVGVAKDNDLVFSSIGRWSGYIFRHKKSLTIWPADSDINQENNFSQITVGEAVSGDVLIIANYSLFDFFSLEKIKDVVLKLNPNTVAEQLKNLANGVSGAEIVGLILKYNGVVAKKTESSSQKYLQEFYGSEESMQQLGNLEQRTSRTLSASLWPNLLKLKKFLFENIKFKRCKKSARKELSLPKENVKSDINKLSQSVWPQKINIGRLKAAIIKTGIFNNKKIVMRSIMFLIIIFAASIFYLNYEKKVVKRTQELEIKLSLITDKKNQAEAVLIYDKEKAQTLLQEALDLSKSYYGVEAKWQNAFNGEEKAVIALLNKINNIYEVSLNIVADLSSINSPIKNIFKNKGVWQIFLDNGSFYELDNKTQSPVYLWQDEKIKLLVEIESNIIYLDQNNKIYFLNKDGVTKELPINLAANTAVAEVVSYNDNFYYLDNIVGDIKKISFPLTDVPKISVWYFDDKNLIKGARSMMIDGNIWLVNGDKILKFFKGKKENFSLGKINQPLGNDLEIYTEKDWSLLYILDKQNKRLMVVNKENGAILRQYLNNDLGAVKKIIIDDKQENALVVIEKNIYKMEVK